jgi:hypothetical protein
MAVHRGAGKICTCRRHIGMDRATDRSDNMKRTVVQLTAYSFLAINILAVLWPQQQTPVTADEEIRNQDMWHKSISSPQYLQQSMSSCKSLNYDYHVNKICTYSMPYQTPVP